MMMEIRGKGLGAGGWGKAARMDRPGAAGGFGEQLTALLDQRPAAPRPAEAGAGAVKLAAAEMAALKTELIRHGAKPPAGGAAKPAAAVPPVEYTVQPGDTLWKIGRQRFKTDPYQIARDNGIADPHRIRPGQKLLIYPPPVRPAPAPVSGAVTASWYGAEHHNKTTASGEPFNMYRNTLAHKTLPLGTRVRLVNPANGRVAEGVVNDRGPYIQGRDVDVSYALARRLGFVQKGVATLEIETLEG